MIWHKNALLFLALIAIAGIFFVQADARSTAVCRQSLDPALNSDYQTCPTDQTSTIVGSGVCPNGILDAGEECENLNPLGNSCLWNSPACSQSTCQCNVAGCGDRIIDPDGPDNNPFTPADNEACDGGPAGSATCTSSCDYITTCPLPNQPGGFPYKMKLVSGNKSASGPNLFFGAAGTLDSNPIFDFNVLADIRDIGPPSSSGSYSMDFVIRELDAVFEPPNVNSTRDLNLNITDLKDGAAPLTVAGNPRMRVVTSTGNATAEKELNLQGQWTWFQDSDNIDVNIQIKPVTFFPELDDTNIIATIYLRFDVACGPAAGCGNGASEPPLEQCDAGAANSNAPNAACRMDCTLQRCGDLILDDLPGEECEPPNTASCDAFCQSISAPAGVCGNGDTVQTLEPDEECETNNPANSLCNWGSLCNSVTCQCSVSPPVGAPLQFEIQMLQNGEEKSSFDKSQDVDIQIVISGTSAGARENEKTFEGTRAVFAPGDISYLQIALLNDFGNPVLNSSGAEAFRTVVSFTEPAPGAQETINEVLPSDVLSPLSDGTYTLKVFVLNDPSLGTTKIFTLFTSSAIEVPEINFGFVAMIGIMVLFSISFFSSKR